MPVSEPDQTSGINPVSSSVGSIEDRRGRDWEVNKKNTVVFYAKNVIFLHYGHSRSRKEQSSYRRNK